ncbi:MFS transporter [Vallicoccus soli]|uniref:MFS transporter n=1 Tax=Vallicoccus soli TaxID=2339232 RepID=UPI00140337A1|nr:MFS transporter [Vallicoccus soli]
MAAEGGGTPAPAPGGAAPARATFRDVLAVREFRALWGAHLLSVLGDQLALVALAVLVFERTGSPLLTAAAYAVSYLPWAVAGPLLSGLADRVPRRSLMVAADLVRAVLLLLMALPGVPLQVLLLLLLLAELCAPPFAAARAAALPDVLPGDRYVVGSAVTTVTTQVAQAAGFALGGLLVAVLGARGALALDAVTFLASAALVRLLVGEHRPPRAASLRADAAGTAAWLRAEARGLVASSREGLALLAHRRDLLTLAGLGWLCAFYVVPEGLAAPWADALGGGEREVGLLLAAAPAGSVVGALVLSRLVDPPRRLALMGPLAVLGCAALALSLLRPGLVGSLALLAVSGAAAAYQLPANAAFVAAVPPESRGQAFGLVQSGINVVQGAAILLAGAVAQAVDVLVVVGTAGLLGCVAALLLWRAWLGAPAPARVLADG